MKSTTCPTARTRDCSRRSSAENIHNLTISPNGRYVFATQPLQAADPTTLFDAGPGEPASPLDREHRRQLDYPWWPRGGLRRRRRRVAGGVHPRLLRHEAWSNFDGTGRLHPSSAAHVRGSPSWTSPTGSPTGRRTGQGDQHRAGDAGTRRTATSTDVASAAPPGERVRVLTRLLFEELNPFAGPGDWLNDITDESIRRCGSAVPPRDQPAPELSRAARLRCPASVALPRRRRRRDTTSP